MYLAFYDLLLNIMDPRIHRRTEPEKGPGDLVSVLTFQIVVSQIHFMIQNKHLQYIHMRVYL